MSRLPLTSQALLELRVSNQHGFGEHLDGRIATGVPGLEIGEVPFDPLRHSAEGINPVSLMETVFDVPHVSQVMPFRPMEMNVVLHQDPNLRHLPSYLLPVREYKNQIATELINSIADSMQVSDQTKLFMVGDTEKPVGLTAGRTRTLEDTTEPAAAAQAIAEVCARGLTFVISDFNNLPLDTTNGYFDRTIAVKANHPLELALPANIGRVTLGGLREVDTNKTKQLRAINEDLAEVRNSICSKLSSLGIATAEVVFNKDLPGGFDRRVVDEALAEATRAARR